MELDPADRGGVVLERSLGGEHYSGRDKLAKRRTRKRKTKNETISTEVADYVVLMYCSSENVESCFGQRCSDFSTHAGSFGQPVLSVMLLQYARA